MDETERGTLKYAVGLRKAVNEYENLIQYELDYLVLKNRVVSAITSHTIDC